MFSHSLIHICTFSPPELRVPQYFTVLFIPVRVLHFHNVDIYIAQPLDVRCVYFIIFTYWTHTVRLACRAVGNLALVLVHTEWEYLCYEELEA